ncbi:MAG: hypothetical protein EAX95_09630 [Candidatus Thorarchaeota archaeon]|nr:hypothetical protein [Candidatus Thorarchaeota archaeon]
MRNEVNLKNNKKRRSLCAQNWHFRAQSFFFTTLFITFLVNLFEGANEANPLSLTQVFASQHEIAHSNFILIHNLFITIVTHAP